jgi:hypothetical protein
MLVNFKLMELFFMIKIEGGTPFDQMTMNQALLRSILSLLFHNCHFELKNITDLGFEKTKADYLQEFEIFTLKKGTKLNKYFHSLLFIIVPFCKQQLDILSYCKLSLLTLKYCQLELKLKFIFTQNLFTMGGGWDYN